MPSAGTTGGNVPPGRGAAAFALVPSSCLRSHAATTETTISTRMARRSWLGRGGIVYLLHCGDRPRPQIVSAVQPKRRKTEIPPRFVVMVTAKIDREAIAAAPLTCWLAAESPRPWDRERRALRIIRPVHRRRWRTDSRPFRCHHAGANANRNGHGDYKLSHDPSPAQSDADAAATAPAP